MINYIDGDLIDLAKKGTFNVIVHGCNCHTTMKAGIAPQMAKAFGCDRFSMELWGSDINKLGNIDYQTFVLGENRIWSLEDAKNNRNEPGLTVVNSYTQFNYGRNHFDGDLRPFDYEAFTICMRKMNMEFSGKHIGMPKIGAGLGGGNWNRIENIINSELRDCKVTVVNYKSK
jgi:O-acetyl-ADP-ribose deacetylase (regulator of RNase III)